MNSSHPQPVFCYSSSKNAKVLSFKTTNPINKNKERKKKITLILTAFSVCNKLLNP